MIYTVTFNPALDYTMHMKTLTTGEINRSQSEELFCGGKGINVSYVLKTLGHSSTAMGFVAGFVGDEIQRSLEKAGVACDFVRVENGCSRINVKLRAESETDINGSGPMLSAADAEKLLKKLDSLKSGDFLVIAGSVPNGLDKDIYARMAKMLEGRGVKIALDTTGELLLNMLEYKPFVIKPNLDELGELFNRHIKTVDEAEGCARKLKEMGAVNVLVSMAEKGSLLIDEFGKLHMREGVKGTLVNSVGAGDSMVAGFIAGYMEKGDYEYAHILGAAAGTATAFSPWLADREKIFEFC